MKKSVLYLIISIVLPTMALGQESTSGGNCGIGIGLDYGGIGLNLNFLPDKHLSVTGGLGYNLVGAGVNGGLKYLIIPDKRVTPVITVLYGYNAVIKVIGASEFNKIYYGPSVGGGIHIRSRKNESNFTVIEVFIPVRPKAFDRDINMLIANPQIEISRPQQFTVSVGFHFSF